MTDSGLADWSAAAGVPSPHVLGSALRTAALIDSNGSTKRAARHAYLDDPSGGIYNQTDLRTGETLLIDCGLVRDADGVLYPVTALGELVECDPAEARQTLLAMALAISTPAWLSDSGPIFAAIPVEAQGFMTELLPDPERREAFLIAIASDCLSARAELGARGEEYVAEFARDELIGLGKPALAERVRRVSIYTDTLGYDVTAPLVPGGSRRLEVKTTRTDVSVACAIFISRNEFEVGMRDKDWALVICREVGDECELIGWCRGSTLGPYVPSDAASSYWTATRIVIPRHVLLESIPPAV